jgi:serine/threonine-protein kinase
VVHRDLKPQNVLLTADGTPKITDFGLAKFAGRGDGLTASGALVGTPSYMAPEQAAGNREVGPSADVYALGAVLYACLTGGPPFREPTPLETVVAVLERDPPDPRGGNPKADPDLSAVALKCLEKKPDARYPTAAALAADLGRWQRGEPVTARRRRGLRRLTGWASREPGLAIRLGVLAVCVVAAFARYQTDPRPTAVQHLLLLGVLAGWAGASFACQALVRRGFRLRAVARAWLCSDAVCLTAGLAINRGHDTPLVAVYWLFVAASGLWLQVGLVRFATAVAGFAYAALAVQAAAVGDLRSIPLHHLMAVAVLLATGEAVAYQVRRVRVLRRYYGDDPTPSG